MPTYDISGVPVEFPFEAYDCQLEYMRAVVRALEAGENALLESPTGTGKTLCLLCATLGWRRHQEKTIADTRMSWEAQADPNAPSTASSCPRIWYSSRTHSQLKQVVKELKRTTYRPSTVVLGSRQHYCCHTTVSKFSGAKQNAMCKRARDENRCPFYVGFRKGQGNKLNTNMMDIEETVSACSDGKVCGFYKTREDAKEVELLFIPYDYLINPQTRESLQVKLKNSILIFDEGHNIEKSCESVASFELAPADLSGAVLELDDAFNLLDENPESASVLGDMSPNEARNHFNLLKKNFLALEDSIYSVHLEKDAATDRTIFKARGSHILEIFGRSSDKGDGIVAKDVKRVSMVVRAAIAVLTFGNENDASGLCLDKLQNMLVAMFKPEVSELDKNYQVLLYEDSGEKRGAKRKNMDFFSSVGPTTERSGTPRTLCLWCFSSSVALQDLQQLGVRSLIITSGTLSPLDGTAEAFGLPFPVVLENTHVINPAKQLWGGVLTAGPGDVRLNASFASRDDPLYLQDLGQTVMRFAACVPDGVLLAFQSYAQKESVLRAWRQTGVFDEIQKHKPIFEEPPSHGEMKQMMERFNDAVMQLPTPSRPTGGALLVAVCRGKLCEGIDFTDRQCRLVIMVGVPYPSRMDLKVMLKQDFLDARGVDGDGRKWYVREAIRAVNQTIGRVIRHRNDFGGVLLCDDRYASNGRLAPIASRLPSWLRSSMAVRSSCEAALATCKQFFLSHGGSVDTSRPAVTQPAPTQHMKEPAIATPPEKQQQLQQRSRLYSAPSVAAIPLGLPLGVASVLAAAQRSGARGTPASSIGALFRAHREARSNIGSQQTQPVSTIATVRHQSVSSTGFGSSKTAAGSARQLATPQVLAINMTQVLPAAQTRPAASAPSAPAAPSKKQVVKARAADRLRSRYLDGAVAKQWLQATERLLPRMEFDHFCDELLALHEQADSIIAGNNSDEAGEARLRTCMAEVAATLLPEFNFDSQDEENVRKGLVIECSSFQPSLVRSLWRKCVEDHLQAQGKPALVWGPVRRH